MSSRDVYPPGGSGGVLFLWQLLHLSCRLGPTQEITFSLSEVLQVEPPFRSRLSPQALHRAPASVKIGRSSTRTAHVCAEPDLSSTTTWISKARPQIVYMTASLRSVEVLINVTCLHLFGFYSLYTEIIIVIMKRFICLQNSQSGGEIPRCSDLWSCGQSAVKV